MNTFINVNEQTKLFLFSCAMGAALGIVFDFLRSIRIIFKHKKSAIFVEDFLFTIFFAMTVFIFSTQAVGGAIRFFVLFGSLLGFIVYLLTVGVVVVSVISVVFNFVMRAISLLYKTFVRPILKLFVYIYQKSNSLFVKCCKSFSKFKNKREKRLKPKGEMVYNKSTYQQNNINKGGRRNGRKSKKEKKIASSPA